jgi:hypothetical protein
VPSNLTYSLNETVRECIHEIREGVSEKGRFRGKCPDHSAGKVWNGARWLNDIVSGLNSGGIRFEYQLDHQLPCLRFFVILLSPYRHVRNITL